MEKPNLFGLGSAVVIGLAVVLAMSTLSGAIVRTRGGQEVIRVTGSARKDINSDFIIWNGQVAVRAETVGAAYEAVKKSTKQVKEYLTKNGIKPGEVATQAITTNPVYATVKTPIGNGQMSEVQKVVAYELSQTIEVQSSNVELLDKVSRNVTDLIASGVNFVSNPPQFIFTKISEEKVAILGDAAKDARQRAETIAKSAGASLGEVRSARMSPLQITPKYSNTVSYDGENDRTSREKAITAIVSLEFSVR